VLLEAIQHRDAPRAVPLAQRCVHRHGMAALEALLERADAVSGQEGAARSWLLAQLKQERAEPVPPSFPAAPPESVSAPILPTAEPPASTIDPIEADDRIETELRSPHPRELEAVSAVVAAPASAADSTRQPAFVQESALADEAPLLVPGAALAGDDALARETDSVDEASAHLQLALIDEAPFPAQVAPAAVAAPADESFAAGEEAPAEKVAFAEETFSVAESVSVQGAAVSVDPSLAHGAAAPVSASVSAALDLAFAPLEIAFPPLPPPALEQREASEPPAAPTPEQEGSSPFFTDIRELSPPEGGLDPANSTSSDGEIILPVECERLPDPFEAGTAAPIPRFQVDDPPEREFRPSRKKRQPDEPKDSPAPVAKALEAWRAWLPGAFRSRNRS
jgi:hypothetical protein